MGYKDADKQRDYQRNWARERRSKVSTNKRAVELEWRLETAADLKGILELIVSQVMGAEELDIGIKGRVVASLLTVGVRLLEVGSIEERLEKLETKMLPVGGIRK
jgi:hypothetical protein